MNAVRTVELFGSQLGCLTLPEACDAAEEMIRARDRMYVICVKDVALTIRSRSEPFLRGFYERADLVVVDGRGLFLAARLLGRPLPGLVGGPNLYEEMLRRAVARGYRVYMLGARTEVVQEAVRHLGMRHPGLRVVGWHDGYFGGSEEDVVAGVASSGAEIVFVGISSPFRERFLDAWRDRMPPCVCIPIGGVIDVEAGITRLAPRWVGRLGMEWLFRAAQEPRRLLPRYAATHTRFAILLMRELALMAANHALPLRRRCSTR